MKENFENMVKLKCTQLNFGSERIIIIDNELHDIKIEIVYFRNTVNI